MRNGGHADTWIKGCTEKHDAGGYGARIGKQPLITFSERSTAKLRKRYLYLSIMRYLCVSSDESDAESPLRIPRQDGHALVQIRAGTYNARERPPRHLL